MGDASVTAQEVKDAVEKERVRLVSENAAQTANWFACAACDAGLNATLAVVILAAIAGFPEDTPAIAAIAAACGISEAAVTVILAGGAAGLETVISELCKAMGACS